jgi:hypothetical protein
VESVNEDGYCTPTDEQKANARLISAAPKMYETLEQIRMVLSMSIRSKLETDLLAHIMQLLAEARGEI